MSEPVARPPVGGSDAGSVDRQASLSGFVDKWRARWPEWTVAEVFVPASQRETALAWAALQQELTDAAWGGNDPRPGEAKLGWWQEELVGWGRGARRHPLGAVLQRQPAPWDGLAAALPSLVASRERPANVADAFAALTPFARAVARVDTGLFGGAAAEAQGDDSEVRLVAATLLQSRLLQADGAGIPLAVLARAGDADPRPIWARELRQSWPPRGTGNLPRRLWASLAHARLGQLDPTRPAPRWKALLGGWRAARG